MPSSHLDETHDYGFADKALALREHASLTQLALAALLGVSGRAIQAWESGLSYPGAERLRQLIALYVERGAFPSGQEEDAAAALWEAVRTHAPRRTTPFDRTWFASLHSGAIPSSPSAPRPPAAGTSAPRWDDWGEAPDAATFHGRAAEVETLSRWLSGDHCRLVGVLGMGGIGKTLLAARLAREVAPRFAVVYWRSLRNALPVEEWLAGAIAALSEAQVLLPDGLAARLRLLLELLRARRGLLVLDNLETILEPGAPEACYREGYAGYGEVVRRVGESVHQGCLLVTGREAPPELVLLARDRGSVRTLRLGGLGQEAGRALLVSQRLVGDDRAWEALIGRYSGNPLALSVVGETIGAVFGGDVAAFLAQDTAVFGEIRQLLDGQVERLSPLERTIGTWLAVEREPVGFAEVVADLGSGVARGEVVEAVEALLRRSLLERGGDGAFTLQPVVLEYVTGRLIAALAEEILAGEPALLVSHALLKAVAKDYVRRSQERLIAEPLLTQLSASLGTAEAVERHLLALLGMWRERPAAEQGYGPGNMVNLLRLLRGELRGLDLSGLTLRQAYLKGIEAQGAILAGAHLSEAVLAEAFNSLMAIGLSRDGAYLAVGTSTGEIALWRIADRTLLQVIQAHAGPIRGVALSGDGGLVACAGQDGTVRLWEADSGRPLAILQGHIGVVWSVALSADGQLLASASYDGTIRLWEAPGGRPLAILHGYSSEIWNVALSADGGLVASGSYDGTVRLWEADSGRLLASLQGNTGAARGVALSGDGGLVACAGQDGTIRLWEATPASGPPGRPVATLQGHSEAVQCVALSGDGGLMASGGYDGTVRLWDALGGRLLNILQGHSAGVWGAALSGDGRLVASASYDGTIRLWEAPGGRPLAILHGYGSEIWGVATSGDGRLVAGGSQDGTIRLWDASSERPLATIQGHSRAVWGVALSTDGQLLASSSYDGTVRLWEAPSGQLLATLRGHTDAVQCVALSADGGLVVSGSFDGTVRLWEAPSGRPLATLRGHTGLVYSVALSGDGRLVASGSYDGTVRLWDASSGGPLETLQGDTSLVHGVALSADGRLVASGNSEGTIRLWETSAGRLLATLPGHTGAVWSVALSADGRLLASGGFDGAVRLWEVASGDVLATLQGHSSVVQGVALSTNGQLLVSGGQDGTVRVWTVKSGEYLHTLRSDRAYERMDITGLTGVTEAQRAALRALGAVEQAPAQTAPPMPAGLSPAPTTRSAPPKRQIPRSPSCHQPRTRRSGGH